MANCLSEWKCLTSDSVVLGYVKGYEIEFDELPIQEFLPNEYRQNKKQKSVLQTQIDDLVDRGIVSKVPYTPDLFVSNVFGRMKPNGDIRMIIDLSDLNDSVKKFHFKMDHLDVALDLVDQGVFMSSIDLKDAYYSIPIWDNHRKYLSFQWESEMFQFNVLPFGLSSAPRIFTKILKPIFAKLREEGFSVLGYIDDSLIMGKSVEECQRATTRLAELLTDLGFTINREKSSLVPTQQITFLGYTINSVDMVVFPTEKKRQKAIKIVDELLMKKNFKIRFVASAIGFIVDLCKGIEYGAGHYRCLERDKVLALQRVGVQGYEGSMFLSAEARKELKWWKLNVRHRVKKIRVTQPNHVLTTDASLQGWGAVYRGEQTGGRWSIHEQTEHINVLELRAILLGLQTFFKSESNVEVLIKSDNTTAVSYVNKMGGSRSKECESVSKQIWNFCEQKQMWLVATYIPGIENVQADFCSRNFTDNTEWILNPHIFEKICDIWGVPDIDMFASRLNHKVETYVSWGKDPCAIENDAFTVDWDHWNLIYVFPPFSLISKCIRKIRRTRASVILVVPEWSGQVWFAQLRKPLVRDMMKFPPRPRNLLNPNLENQGTLIRDVPLRAVLC